MDCPSTPAAPLFALTRLYASHTSCFGILNGFTSGLDLLTRLLPDQTPGCSCDQDRMSQPLRSALITRVSSLLRAGPPARHESVLDASQFPLLGALPLAPSPNPRKEENSIGRAFPRSPQEPTDRTHAACMPDTTWPIDGHPPGSSRDCIETPVSTSFPTSRHFISGLLSFVFPIPHLTAFRCLFLDAHHNGLHPMQLKVV